MADFDDDVRTSGRKMIPADTLPIDWLMPDSDQHTFVREYLMNRLKYSVRRMSAFHPRWQSNELLLQAYISLPDYDMMLKNIKDSRESPSIGDNAPVSINVPFAWATVNTIVTYLLHMFAGRKPIFQVGSYRPEQVARAKNMEMLLQYNADVVKFVRSLYFFLMDGETYGVAVMRTLWRQEEKTREVSVPPSREMQIMMESLGQTAGPEKKSESYVSFEGSTCTNVDPFMFFPDPRVPMHEVNEKGEWVFWRAYMGKFQLLRDQAAGLLKWVDKVGAHDRSRWTDANSEGSSRGIRALGAAHPGNFNDELASSIEPNYQVDQGTIEIIPYDLGLGDSKLPEKWIFTILNERQIVQAQPISTPNGRHPIVVAEPNSLGYSFGQLGTVDMLGPMQNMMSWFMNSHIHNVRAVLNNMLVVDPTKVEMQDFKSGKPGKLIRLKNTAFGLADAKSAVHQLEVTDVTRSHLSDMQLFGRLAADMTGATDNNRGLQDAGGRKTATEIRTSAEAGTSRLAAKGKVYSSMALTDLAEMWAINAQENLTQEFELQILGSTAAQDTVRITPDSIAGDFFFPVHDGTLPMDKIGLLEVWKEIFQAVLGDQQLRQQYDVMSMFDWIAQLGGAQNIKSFRLNVVPQEQQAAAIGGGQGVPVHDAAAMLGGVV